MEEEAVEKKKAVKIDPAWEFMAPKYYDFCAGETDNDKVTAEFWFANATSYDASPHAGKSKPVAELLNLETQEEDMEEVSEYSSPDQNKENQTDLRSILISTPSVKVHPPTVNSEMEEDEVHDVNNKNIGSPVAEPEILQEAEVSPSTPKTSQDGGVRNTGRRPLSVMPGLASSPGSVPAKRLHSEGWKEVQVSHPATMPKLQQSSMAKRSLTTAKRKEVKEVLSHRTRTPVSPDDPANKKQKLEGGRLRQIKERVVRPNEAPPAALTRPQEFKFCTDKRSRQHGGADVITTMQAGRANSPFVSMAEKVRSFQCKTPERFHINPSNHHETDDHEKKKMKLTRPKTPDFETSHRVRRPKVKSTAELEVEMLAKVPKFKARPAPRKILEGPPPALVQKSTPQVPEFHEFHFRTTERALQHKGSAAEQRGLDPHDQTSATAKTDPQSIAELKQRHKSASDSNILSEPRDPQLHTATRVRPLTVKTSEDMELEDLAKVPRFRARPLNKRIFESRGDLGLFRNNKREATIPQEFHFATDERLQLREPPLEEQFGKISLQQHSTQETSLRPTIPEPFHLETEERGLVKGMRFLQDILIREQEETQARVPRAHPLPFTTDVPDIPPKPEPKECTQPEPFQLESLVRHEEELQRFADDRKRAYDLESALKAFRAQPNLSVGPVFVPARSRKPLTEVHEFTFHLESRATERADFDQRVTEKHNQYKRFREEYEAARKAEEDRSIKAMRKEMVPLARPMPAYNRPFVPHRSTKELTRPVSPQFNLQPSRMPSSARRRSSSTSTASVRRRMGQMR